MAIYSYFFNSILKNGEYDRPYNSEDMTSYLDMIVGNGVFPTPSTQLQVSAGGGMTVNVAAGQGWINGHKLINTAVLPLTISGSDVILNRIDRVIFYVDHGTRAMGIEVLKGTPAANAVAPALTRTSQRYEMCLAQITVNKQVTSITNAMIADTRGNSSLCGYVRGLIDQIEADTLFQQWDAEFNEWFGEIKDEVSTSTLLRKFEGNYTTKTVNEKTFNVKNYVSNYANALDILEVRINGLTLTTNEYTRNGDVVTLVTPIAETGTPISFAVYKSVDGSDAETVIDEVAEMQTIVNTLETGMYIATGDNDLTKLSRIVNTFLDGASDYRQLKIDVYGDLDCTTPASVTTSSNTANWFSFYSTNESIRRVILDFAHASRIVVDCSAYSSARLFDTTNRNIEIRNVQAVMNSCNNANLFTATSNPTVHDSAFWMTGTGNGATVGAYQGTFINCRFSATNTTGTAYCISGNGNVVRLENCELIAYNAAASTGVESVAVHVQADQTENVLIMTNCSCPIRSRSSYKQDNTVKVNRGYYCLTGNMLGMAALLYNTGEGMTEIGTMIVSK